MPFFRPGQMPYAGQESKEGGTKGGPERGVAGRAGRGKRIVCKVVNGVRVCKPARQWREQGARPGLKKRPGISR